MSSDQQRVAELRALREFALEAARLSPGHEIHEAALEVLAARLYELVVEPDPARLKEQLEADGLAGYARMVNTLVRLSAAALAFQRYRAEVAERKAKLEAEFAAAKKGGLTPENLGSIQEQLRLL